uniref:BTAD domain-containing putative transcriptional regulator n=1 Tax=Pseudonocardia lacus TaxID=2835865 RepID=UPI001BDC22B9
MTVRIDVLGPLRARVSDAPADLGGRRRRALLARLAVAGGRVVSTDALVEDLWAGESPPRALAALQVHVSHLRRVLEPDRPPRGAATVVVSSPPGYALHLDPDALDARLFERLVGEAAVAAPGEAERLLGEALGLWAGAAFAEFAGEAWAAPEAARLEELRLVAAERLAQARLATGRPAAAVPDLERHVHDHPLREGAVRLLASALYQDGRQADALAVLARTRRLLAEELGVDPGPELRDLERDVLAQTAPGRAARPAPEPPRPRPTAEATATTTAGAAAPPTLLGRAADLARLRAAGDQPGGCRLVLVSGDAGAGKSALVEAFRAERAAAGWTTAVGRCPEVDGAPAGWAWRELVDQLLAGHRADAELVERLGPLRTTGPTSADRTFWLAQAVTELLAGVAAGGPVLVVLDDLHRAEDETLQLLRSVVAGLAAAPVLVVASLRPAEVGADLESALAALAGPIADRIALAGLAEPAVRELLRRQGAADVDAAVVALVTERTGGNPLFVRELARLIVAEGASAAADEVPSGVRDVLRRRVERLPGPARTVLRQAAVLGRDVEIDVLVRLVGGDDEDAVLDALEMGVLSGLLTEPRAGWVRFAHALVRDTLYGDVPRLRRTRLHAAALGALLATGPDDHAALAHHALAAGPAVPPAAAL